MVNISTGLLPLSLLNLPNLSTLYLHNNQLVGPLPSHVSGLNLIDLFLSSNSLNGTLPSWLFSLPSLEILRLDDNEFIGEIGEFKYNSLGYLDLGYKLIISYKAPYLGQFLDLWTLIIYISHQINWALFWSLKCFQSSQISSILIFHIIYLASRI